MRYQMVHMAKSVPGIYPNQLSFNTCAHSIIHVILGFLLASAGTIPKRITHLHEEVIHHVLPVIREERTYPRIVEPKAKKFPNKKKASQLN